MVSTTSESNKDAERPWTIGEVCDYLRLSEATVRQRMRDSGLPYKKIGRAIRFDRAEVQAWFSDQERAA